MKTHVNWVQVDKPDKVRDLLEDLFNVYKNVEILSIVENQRGFNVWYKFAKLNKGEQKWAM